MAGAVFPEKMNKLDTQDPAGSLKTVEAYIAYMTERTEFSMKNTLRTAEASGVTNAAVLLMISSLSNSLSALQSTVNQQSGEITSIKSLLSTLSSSVESNSDALKMMQETVDELAERVAALETPSPEA